MVPAGKYRIAVKRISQRFTLYGLGDIHLGNANCCVSKLRTDVEEIAADPDSRVILMGDLADYIAPKDRRFEAASITPDIPISALKDWGRYLAGEVVKELSPLKGKIIGVLTGNHEHTFEAQQMQQLQAWVAQELDTQQLGYSCFIDLVFGRGGKSKARRRYRIFAHHGAGGATSPGGKTNRLIKFMHYAEADLYFVGHVHEKDPRRIDYLGANDNCTELIEKKKLGVFTGTYLKTYQGGVKAGYGERAGYAPVPLGCSGVEFQPFDHNWGHRSESMVARVTV